MALPSREYAERWVSANMQHWSLTDWVLNNPARFKAIAFGRQGGKTTTAMRWLHNALEPDGNSWLIQPFRIQAKRVVWPRMRMIAAAAGLKQRHLSESDLVVTWPNGHRLQLHGADNPSSMAGDSLNRAVIDEFRWWQKPEMVQENIRPMLTHSKGGLLYTSTTHGHDHFYDVIRKGQDPEQTDWASLIMRTIDSPFVDPLEVEAARRDMDPVLFAQEYESSFETGGDRCAWNFNHEMHVTDHGGKIPEMHTCWVGIDFNISPMVAEVAGYMVINGKRTLHFFDEFVLQQGGNTSEMADMIRKKYPQILDIYPDPTGKSASTISPKSDHDLLHVAGFNVRAHQPGSPKQNERLSAWNRMLLDAEGTVRMTISPRCKRLIDDCDKAMRRPDGTIDKRHYDPHALDAASYGVEYLHPIIYRGVSKRRSA